MFAILVMATVISRITISSARPCGERSDYNLCGKDLYFHEDYIMPDITDQVNPHEHDSEMRHRSDYELPPKADEMKPLTEESTTNLTTMPRDDVDDDMLREDHITQHLSDSMVNTDSEITSLMESEVEENVELRSNKDDGSISSLRNDEQAMPVEDNPYFLDNTVLNNIGIYEKYI